MAGEYVLVVSLAELLHAPSEVGGGLERGLVVERGGICRADIGVVVSLGDASACGVHKGEHVVMGGRHHRRKEALRLRRLPVAPRSRHVLLQELRCVGQVLGELWREGIGLPLLRLDRVRDRLLLFLSYLHFFEVGLRYDFAARSVDSHVRR